MKVELITYTPDAEKVVASAAKLCYSKATVTNLFNGLADDAVKNFLDMLMGIGHESPVEHVSFTFGIEGVSRITEIQLVRHRLASYSIQSGRYVNRSNPNFIIPPNIEEFGPALGIYNKIKESSTRAFNDIFIALMLKQMGYSELEAAKLIDKDEACDIVGKLYDNNKALYGKYEKVAIEDARYAHLQSLATQIMMTMNARELLHFFNHRCCNRAQWEIKDMANLMLLEVKKVCPTLFKFAGPSCLRGICPEGSMSCGKMTEMRSKYLIP